MLLRSSAIGDLLDKPIDQSDDPLIITPKPETSKLRGEGTASVDLRLGTWFLTIRARRHHLLDIYVEEREVPSETNIANKYYTPFGKKFIIHPGNFVLAVTLEWLRLPTNLAGFVTGKSSWGRRGLIIETAPTVHPGFSGCLTLELTNVGEIPIAIMPGTNICQLSLHKIDTDGDVIAESGFEGQRQPRLGLIRPDEFAHKLMRKS